MRFLVLGATGRTGKWVSKCALARGHSVTALARDIAKLDSTQGLAAIKGDVTLAEDIANAAKNCDVIISCLGQNSAHDAGLLERSAAAVLAALRRTPTKRYIVVSQGLLFETSNPLVAVLRWFLRRQVADSTAMEKLIRQSPFDWTIVRPPRLVDRKRPRGYVVEHGQRPRGPASMARVDLAEFLVVAAEGDQFDRSIVGITSQ